MQSLFVRSLVCSLSVAFQLVLYFLIYFSNLCFQEAGVTLQLGGQLSSQVFRIYSNSSEVSLCCTLISRGRCIIYNIQDFNKCKCSGIIDCISVNFSICQLQIELLNSYLLIQQTKWLYQINQSALFTLRRTVTMPNPLHHAQTGTGDEMFCKLTE